MATTNLQLATPANGSDIGTWDQPLNANSVIVDAVAGNVTTTSLTNADVTLTTTQARVAILRFTGALTGNCIVTLPAIIKSWICENLTTGAFVVKISGGSGNVVALRPGSSQVYWDGTNVKYINLGGVGDYWDTSEADTPLWVSNCTVPPALKCDGSTFNAGTYPILNAHLAGNTLPDFRGRGAFYLNGSSGRITTAGSGVDGDTRFAAGGAQNITLDTTMIPAHAHTSPAHHHFIMNTDNVNGSGLSSANTLAVVNNNFGNANAYSAGGSASAATVGLTSDTTVTIDNTGGGLAHNNMPPAVMSGVRMIWAG